jgi:hypothetical protein
MNALKEIAARDYQIPLERSYDALRVVVNWIETPNTLEAHETVLPLQTLVLALSDTLKGGKPEYLKHSVGGTGRPSDLSFASLQGAVAGAMALIIAAPGGRVSRDSAATLVSKRAHHFGLRDHKGQRITKKQVASWRDRVGVDLPEAAADVFRSIIEIRPESECAAKAHVDHIFQAVALAGLATGKIPENP